MQKSEASIRAGYTELEAPSKERGKPDIKGDLGGVESEMGRPATAVITLSPASLFAESQVWMFGVPLRNNVFSLGFC